ncbi:MAG: CDP-diacylglycerol--glycerol-3-phosphate 3-phosphatidyltransferase [Acidobacteria bacterium RBG_16_70_10]|nr:MAG: CDP-diacylglycerol--glycerol-3-phosphate 3-phosphatidyltransferase [Acidobacteria bacterium RBG_16_70_10]
MNLPNALTLLRIFLVPVLVAVLLTRVDGHVFLGAGIFALAVATDYLDGYLARRRNQVTRLGILLDPLADKLLIAAAFLSLVEMGLVPAWVVMIILARELAVTGLRNVAAGRGVLIGASALGKAKMVAQVTCVLLLLLSRPYPVLRAPALGALVVVVALTLGSGADYARRFWRDVLRPVTPDPLTAARPDPRP